MLHGPLYGKILTFSIPLIASGILQQSFNAIDVAVIGRYSTTQAIAAVGSNGPIISILVNLFLGIAIGANAVIATYLGQKNHDAVRRSVSTVAIISLLSGFILMFLGITLARPILEAMSAPPDVIDLAEEYLSIFFCGMPFMMTYNFGSAIMRSVGDTSLPFYALLVSTVCNLLLDWLFAGVFGWGVSGVAWATVISTGVNAAIIVYFLAREPQPVTLSLKLRSWRLSRPDFNKMLRIGIPAGLQGMVFSISNIFIQSAINSFGSDAIAGSAAALTYEVYCYYIVSAFCAATIAFTGQNYGSGEYGRCKSVLRICMLYSVVLCGASNLLVAWQGHAFISLFSGLFAHAHASDRVRHLCAASGLGNDIPQHRRQLPRPAFNLPHNMDNHRRSSIHRRAYSAAPRVRPQDYLPARADMTSSAYWRPMGSTCPFFRVSSCRLYEWTFDSGTT